MIDNHRHYSALVVIILYPLICCFRLSAENYSENNETFEKSLENIWISGERADHSAVPALIKLLKDSNYTIRQTAAAALGKIRDKRAIDPLIDCIIDDSSDIQNTAVIALSRFGKAAVVSLVNRYKEIFEEFNPVNQYLPPPSAASTITKILFKEHADSDSPPALLPLPDSESVIDCRPRFHPQSNKYLQKMTANLIANSRDTSAVSILMQLLLTQKCSIKEEICRLLISRKDSRVVPFLLKHEQAGDSLLLPWKMLEILVAIPDIHSIGYFKKSITQNNCYTIADACIKVGEQIVPTMEAWLKDSSIALRSCACKVLCEIDCQKYKSLLKLQLNDTSFFLKSNVIKEMSNCKDITLSSFVYKLTPDTSNPQIRYAIEDYRREEIKFSLDNLLMRIKSNDSKRIIDTSLMDDLYRVIVNGETKNCHTWVSGTHDGTWESNFIRDLLPYLDEYVKVKDQLCRNRAFEMITYMSNPNRNAIITNGLVSQDPEIVLHALRSIADSGDTTCYTIPSALFNDPNYMVRYFAAIVASRCTSRVYNSFLLPLLKETSIAIPAEMVRYISLFDTLIRFNLDMPNQNNGGSIGLFTVADAAAYAFGNKADKSVLPILRQYLKDCSNESAPAGLATLKLIASDSDVEIIKNYLKCNLPYETRELAMGCLFHLNIKATQKIICDYVQTHSDFASVVGLKCLLKKCNCNTTDIGLRLINNLKVLIDIHSKMSYEDENTFRQNTSRDSLELYHYASRLLIQASIEMLSNGLPSAITPSMNLLNSYSYDCCAAGETWASALERIHLYESNQVIDTLVTQLKKSAEIKGLLFHFEDVLKKQKSKYAMDKVAELLSESDTNIRKSAVKILFHIADSTIIGKLHPLLNDPLFPIRMYVFSTLYNLNDSEPLNHVKEDFFNSIDSFLCSDQTKGNFRQCRDTKLLIAQRFYPDLFKKNSIHFVPQKRAISKEFHERLFKMVLKGNWIAEYYLDYSHVNSNSSTEKLLSSSDSWDRLNALRVYITHPGTAPPEVIVRLLDDENFEIQVLAGKYLLLSKEKNYYKKVYDYITYQIHRFQSKKCESSFFKPLSEQTLIELCTDNTSLQLHRGLLHSTCPELRFSAYKALLKMDSNQAESILVSPPFPKDTVYINQFKRELMNFYGHSNYPLF